MEETQKKDKAQEDSILLGDISLLRNFSSISFMSSAPNRIVCNSTNPHFDTRYWHADLLATQHVIILKQNVEMPSCLQLNMSSFSYKMSRCWDVELTATQQVVMLKQNVELPRFMQLSKSSFPYKKLKFKFGKTFFVTRYSDTEFLELGKSLSWMALLSFRSITVVKCKQENNCELLFFFFFFFYSWDSTHRKLSDIIVGQLRPFFWVNCAHFVKSWRLSTVILISTSYNFLICHILWHFQDGRHWPWKFHMGQKLKHAPISLKIVPNCLSCHKDSKNV